MGSPEALAMSHRDGSALLVLDNCEHLAGAAAEFVARLLGAGEAVSVVATSRVPLGLPDEQLLVLDPLDLPAADDPDHSDHHRPRCSSNEPTPSAGGGLGQTSPSPPCARSAAMWTGCRSPSSSPRLARGRFRRSRSSPSWSGDSTRCTHRDQDVPRGTAACAPPSTCRSTRSTPKSSGSSIALLCSPARSISNCPSGWRASAGRPVAHHRPRQRVGRRVVARGRAGRGPDALPVARARAGVLHRVIAGIRSMAIDQRAADRRDGRRGRPIARFGSSQLVRRGRHATARSVRRLRSSGALVHRARRRCCSRAACVHPALRGHPPEPICGGAHTR